MKKKKNREANSCSMTGYGKAAHSTSEYTVEVEVKTLNNRHLDLNIKLPREYSEFELKLRELAGYAFKRGRVDIYVSRCPKVKNKSKLVFNENLYRQFSKVFTVQAKKLKILEEEYLQEALIQILSRKDVLEVAQEDSVNPAEEKKILFKLISQAFSQVQKSRWEEGSKLIKDIEGRSRILINCLSKIKKISAGSTARTRENLLRKIGDLSIQELEPGRLEQETALLVMRSDITEEIVRLSSHLESLLRSINKIDGKKLEFTLQEVLREFNTIGSKSNDIEITNIVIEAKTNIERIREQSQNIE